MARDEAGIWMVDLDMAGFFIVFYSRYIDRF